MRCIKFSIFFMGVAAFVACMGPGKATTSGGNATDGDAKYLASGAPVPGDRISYRVDSEPTTIAGTVSLRKWRKSSLSYCAQGGPFPVIAERGRSTVLLFRDKRLWKKVVDGTGRQKLRGFYLQKYIPHPKRGAHTVTGTPYFQCRVFEVRALAR